MRRPMARWARKQMGQNRKSAMTSVYIRVMASESQDPSTAPASPLLSWLRPVQVFMQKVECPAAIDGVGTVKDLDFCAVADSEFDILAAGFGKLVCDPFIWSDPVIVTAFHHEGTRDHEPAELCIIEGVTKVKLRHIVFTTKDIAIT